MKTNNYNIPQNLFRAIKDNQLVLFVGAGFSKNLNKILPKEKKLPDWNEFAYKVFEELANNEEINDGKNYRKQLNKLNKINRLEKEKRDLEKGKNLTKEQTKRLGELKKRDTKKDYGEILSTINPQHIQIIHQHIHKKFRVDAGYYCELHELALLVTEMIVTTNYDNAIETAYENLHGGARPETFIGPLAKNTFQLDELNNRINDNKGFIFKVHGCATVPDSCIIFEEEYNDLYNSTPQKQKSNSGYYKARRLLENIIENKIILFVGVSFEDEHMKNLFDCICDGKQYYHKHYIITRNKDDETRLKKIPYLNCIKVENYNTCLVEFFRELAHKKLEYITSPNRLRQLLLFRGLSDESICIFNKYEKKFDSNVCLAKCGDEADSFYLILKGIVVAKDEKGNTNIRKMGEIIGEFGFSINERRVRDIICQEDDTHVIEITRETIEKLTPRDQNVLWQNIVYMLYNKEREKNNSETKENELRSGPLEWKKVAEYLSDRLRTSTI